MCSTTVGRNQAQLWLYNFHHPDQRTRTSLLLIRGDNCLPTHWVLTEDKDANILMVGHDKYNTSKKASSEDEQSDGQSRDSQNQMKKVYLTQQNFYCYRLSIYTYFFTHQISWASYSYPPSVPLIWPLWGLLWIFLNYFWSENSSCLSRTCKYYSN